ncbi:Putative aliphatic sulfonates transport permease protein SsuC [Oceanibacterium hippocampi]|uniref:Putative aliphatic sulfonates transport permease protein SsuC n=1 Tax=Oceanibacterium hippocampi TaxID=745714 RepID=A0A1Y5TWM8_9PROT|nr:Putative aliphatic sulfonates transport permease protein SsuC [Oceanibacterium hippocampi]
MARAGYLALGIFIIGCLWEAAIAIFALPPFILPPLASIGGAIWSEFPFLMRGLRATLTVAGAGYAVGAVAAILLALSMVLVPTIERVVKPVIVAINSVPVVAYAPLCLVWFGMGPASKIAMVILAAGFTVFVNALQGLQSVDAAGVNLLRSFGAGPFRIAWMLRLPAALPAIITGLRVAVVRSMIIAIVAEMLGAYEGLGRIIYESTQQIEFLTLWAAIIVASTASMIAYGILVVIDRRLVWWK